MVRPATLADGVGGKGSDSADKARSLAIVITSSNDRTAADGLASRDYQAPYASVMTT
jgi:hypothetical protein